jgi:hypothetical protein
VAASSTEWEASSKCGWSIESSHHQFTSLFDVVYHVGILRTIWLHQRSRAWNSHKVHVHYGGWTFSSDHNIPCYDSSIRKALVCWSSVSNTWASSCLGTEVLCSICFWSTCNPQGHTLGYAIWLEQLTYAASWYGYFDWLVLTVYDHFLISATVQDYNVEYRPEWGQMSFLIDILRPTAGDGPSWYHLLKKASGGCSDLMYSGHMLVAVLTAMAWTVCYIVIFPFIVTELKLPFLHFCMFCWKWY